MTWLIGLAWFCGGAFLVNAVPHLVSGVTGRAFQTPFAKPPGKGLSSSTVNVCWSFFNFAVAYGLITQVGSFEPHLVSDAVVVFAGGLVMALGLAKLFGPLHGGDRAGTA